MRKLALTTTLLMLASAAPLAAANLVHDGCYSQTAPLTLVHVDVFGKPCAGVVVRPSVTTCDENDLHLIEGVHVLLLDGPGCGTGVVVELP